MNNLHGHGDVTSIFTSGVNGTLIETNTGSVVVSS
jgi:hypothetical protein